jgi:hypothetical protein
VEVDTKDFKRSLYRPYYSITDMVLTCKQCSRQWLWPLPYDEKHAHPPVDCRECREKHIEDLKKQIEKLNNEITRLTPDLRERFAEPEEKNSYSISHTTST